MSTLFTQLGLYLYEELFTNDSLQQLVNQYLYTKLQYFYHNFFSLMQVYIGGLLGGGLLGAMVQDFLQDAVLQVMARGGPLIKEDLRNTVVAASNQRLGTLGGFDDLVNFLIRFGNVTNTC